MPNRFLAWIVPVRGDARPEHPIVLPPPGESDPPGIWGGGNEPFPTPPIVIPPDALAPGVPTHPIVLPPPIPTHPIVIPPGSISEDPPVPAHPIVLPPPIPAHPIVIPPDAVSPGVPAHPIYLPPSIWGPDDPRPGWGLPGTPDHPLPPVSEGTPVPPMAYPISVFAHVPGVGIVGPVTVHYPGPLPGHHGGTTPPPQSSRR
jgi:hypothetical protein